MKKNEELGIGDRISWSWTWNCGDGCCSEREHEQGIVKSVADDRVILENGDEFFLFDNDIEYYILDKAEDL